jgi:membrane associated rhomboid family serine protease
MRSQVQAQFPMTPVVKWLLIVNVAIWFFLQVLLEGFGKIPFSHLFALYPGRVLFDYSVWQPLTYMFLHSSSQITHILFNMLMLWFMGAELEQRWGKRFFITYYMVTGVGAALVYCIGMWIYSAITGATTNLTVPVVGASGAIFGLMVAYGMIFGERTMYFMMLFPMKARYFVMILGAIQVASMLTSGVTGGEVAYLAHLGGLLVGYLYLKFGQMMQTAQINKKLKNRSRNLRLVVDNEKQDKQGDGPRYWN